LAGLVRVVQLQRFELDHHEWYSRNDNIQVLGIPEVPDKDTNQLIGDLAVDY